MINYTFTLAGSLIMGLTFTSNSQLTEAQILHLKARLPNLEMIENQKRSADIQLTHEEGQPFSLKQKGGTVFLKEEWKNEISKDFIHLVYGAVRLEWLKKGIFPIHAACVGDDQKGYVLITGRAGTGKTSTTLASALNHHLKIFSGDTTLILPRGNDLMAIGGTKILTIRKKDRYRWPMLEDLFQSLGDREIFQLPQAHYTHKAEVKIKAMVMIEIDDQNEDFSQLSTLSALHTTYPYFIDYERADVLMNEGKDMFVGNLDPTLKRKFIAQLSRALQDVPVYVLKGTRDFICGKIQKLVEDS